jgi:Rod binding domain-containing protein
MIAVVAQASSHQANAAPQGRLVKAAHEFEAQLMKELLKPLTDNADDDETGSAGALGDYAGEALGRALSDQGGFGIADRIIHQVSHSGNRSVSAPVIGMQHPNNVQEAAK